MMRFFICLMIFIALIVIMFYVGFSDNAKEFNNNIETDSDTKNCIQKTKDNQKPEIEKQHNHKNSNKKTNDKNDDEIDSAINKDNEDENDKEVINNDEKQINQEKKTDWKKYKKERETLGNLDSRYDRTFAKILSRSKLERGGYFTEAVDKKFLEKMLDYATDSGISFDNRSNFLVKLDFSYNREIVTTVLDMLSSKNHSNVDTALAYLCNNVFPEYGDEIVSRIIKNPQQYSWFDFKGKGFKIRCIFQIFTYYVNKINIPKFLKAYKHSKNYYESKQSKYLDRCIKYFNSFFSGISSHYPDEIALEDLTPEYWEKFYNQNPEKLVGLQRNNAGEIITPELTGRMSEIHEEFEHKMQTELFFYSWYYKKSRTNWKDDSLSSYPYYLTFVPIVLKDLASSNARERSDSVALRNRMTQEFLTDACQVIYAKEMCETGIKLDKDKGENFCRYFSRIGNYGGYGLKFAIEFLKRLPDFEQDTCNMIVALDEPELIEYLMKFKRRSVYWVTAMVRLTRHTFGSYKEDRKIANWVKYLKDTLPTE